MNRTHLAIVFVAAATLASSALTASAGDKCKCQCHSQSCSNRCQTNDDAGLLSLIDRTAGAVQKNMQVAISLPRMPKFPSFNDTACDGHHGHTCKHGCASVAASPICGCGQHSAAPSQLYATPQHRVDDKPSPLGAEQPWNAPAPRQFESMEFNPHRQVQPMPVPDRMVDPFLDDSVSKIRKIPASTIQHRQPVAVPRQKLPAYGESHDPQAATVTPLGIDDEAARFFGRAGNQSGFSNEAPRNYEPMRVPVTTASAELPTRPVSQSISSQSISDSGTSKLESENTDSGFANPLRP